MIRTCNFHRWRLLLYPKRAMLLKLLPHCYGVQCVNHYWCSTDAVSKLSGMHVHHVVAASFAL